LEEIQFADLRNELVEQYVGDFEEELGIDEKTEPSNELA